MDISQMKDILSQHMATARLYADNSIRVSPSSDGIVVTGFSQNCLLQALRALTEEGPLNTKITTIVGEWCAIISESPAHIRVQTDRAVNSTIIGATITNQAPNQGVQGIFNTPIHFGKK